MVVFCEGILIFHNQQVQVEMPDNDADVSTIPGGMLGVSPGPDQTIVTLTNALPQAGSDFNFQEAKRNRTPVAVKVIQVGSSESMKGKFLVREYSAGGGAGDPVIGTLKLTSVGSPAPIFE